MALEYSDATLALLEAHAASQPPPVPPSPPIQAVLDGIAQTDMTCYPWAVLRIALSSQLAATIKEAAETKQDCPKATVDARSEIIFNGLAVFTHAPFTIQRLCEIALAKKGSTFATTVKLLNAVEKLTRVSSMAQTLTREEYNEKLAELRANKKELDDSASPTASPARDTDVEDDSMLDCAEELGSAE